MAEHADAADGQLSATHDEEEDFESEAGADAPVARHRSDVQGAVALGLIAITVMTTLAGWLGYQGYEAHQAQAQRNLIVQVGRQAALNLTTISHTNVGADMHRILEASVGAFHDDFQKRSPAFIDVVKQAQSTSVGTITAAGLESEDGDHGQVIVAVSVTTSNIGASEQQPRLWRMRIDVQKIGDSAKVSDVEFVP